ncbi:MAG: VWA domain-containing protein [Halieaceae bacterium]|jgi:Ca-activated chloride channel family protein|nr:VWA domain-containing protein [Halieaceae bacterium]
MIDGFHVLRPELLWGLLICPLLALALWHRRTRQGDWSRAIDPELLPYLMPEHSDKTRQTTIWMPILLLSLIVLAASGPSLRQVELPVIKRADALVLVLDLSASMLAADVQPSRIRRARQKILDLLELRVEGVTGLVVFAGDAHVVTPLTDDARTIANLMPALSPNIMPLPGANATSGIEAAANLLITAGAQGGQILLMTDGLPGFDTVRAKNALESSGAALAVMAIGTKAGAPIPLPNGGFLKDDAGEIVIPTLDRQAIDQIASTLNAPVEQISLDERDIKSLTRRNNLAAQGELDLARQTDAWQDQGFWLAALVALLLLPAFRKGALVSLLLLVVMQSETSQAAEWEDLWLTPDQQGAQRLAAGDASGAAERFDQSPWRGMAEFEAGAYDRAAGSFASEPSADGLFNQGNALAMQGDLRGAINAYERSLSLQPNAEDAVANRDFIQSLLDQQEDQEQEEEQEGEEQSQQDEQSEQNDASDSDSGGDGESSDQQDDSQQAGDGQQDEANDQEESEPQDGDRDPNTADRDQQAADQLEAATQEQMAKFDEALEEQQALEQWLRRVPDDPGGLLRRKFRYQTMQRLREGDKPDESIRW